MAALRRWSCLDSQGSTTYRKVWPDTCLGGQLTRRFAPRAPNVGTVTVRVVVDGREVVQIYTAIQKSEVSRPVRELKAFASVEVKAGEQERVTIRVPREVLAYWDVRVHGFVVEGATYRVEAGASSRDIRLHTDVEISGDEVTIPLTTNSTISEVVSVPSGKEALADLVTSSFPDLTEDDGPGLLAMIGSVPVDGLPEFTTGTVTKKALEDKLKAINSSND